MSIHNTLALNSARSLVHLVNTDAAWRQVFSATAGLQYVRSFEQWPVPDAVLVDKDATGTDILCALEFKPPLSSKAECVRGLGQSVTYLNSFDYAALVVPDIADDGFRIAQYIADLLQTSPTSQERIGVYSYPAATTNSAYVGRLPLSPLKLITSAGPYIPPPQRLGVTDIDLTFWAFYRDTSLHEFFIILDKADKVDTNHRTEALDHVYSLYSAKRTNDPQGNRRVAANIRKADFTGHSAVTLNHLNLWGPDGVLTASGRELVHLGRTYGAESAPFRDEFARQALLAGRHYEYIKIIYEFQRNHHGRFTSTDMFATAAETFLDSEGLLRRLPGRATTGSRRFFKHEFTFWGVMLKIIRKHGNSYVVPRVGLDFDWPRIVELVGNTTGKSWGN